MTDLQWAPLCPSVIPQTISPPRLSGYHPQHSHAQLHRREHHLWSSWSRTCPCDRRTLINRMHKDNYKDSIRFDQIRLVAVFSFFESSHQSSWSFRKGLTGRWAPQLWSTHWTKVCILSSVMSDRLVMHLASSDRILLWRAAWSVV